MYFQHRVKPMSIKEYIVEYVRWSKGMEKPNLGRAQYEV